MTRAALLRHRNERVVYRLEIFSSYFPTSFFQCRAVADQPLAVYFGVGVSECPAVQTAMLSEAGLPIS
jgi:hypothetical protein